MTDICNTLSECSADLTFIRCLYAAAMDEEFVTKKELCNMIDYAVFTAPPSLQQHPLSAQVLSSGDNHFNTLKESIRQLGVLNPVTLFEGRVLDGWSRYQAAQELGLPCPARQMKCNIDPYEFLIAQEMIRRHPRAGQRAAFVAILCNIQAMGKVGQ